MSLQDNFKAFLHDIEPSRSTVDEIAGAHMALRSYLEGHDCYSQHCRSTYLSGPYAKNTSIRPVKDEDHRDADVVVDYLHRKRPPVTDMRPPNRDHVTMRHVQATPSMRPLPRLVPFAMRTRRGSDANGEGDKGQAGPGVACKGHGGKGDTPRQAYLPEGHRARAGGVRTRRGDPWRRGGHARPRGVRPALPRAGGGAGGVRRARPGVGAPGAPEGRRDAGAALGGAPRRGNPRRLGARGP